MKQLIALFLYISFAFPAFSQNKATVSLVGSITNFSTSEKLFGATLYLMQNGTTISKAISDETGRYLISGDILTDDPLDLLISKSGYASKKVLFDLNTLRVQKAKSTNLQLLEDLSILLIENKTGANLNFTKSEYAEKFTWDQSSFVAKPDSKFKSKMDERIIEEIEKVDNDKSSKNYVVRGDFANSKRNFNAAIAYYDSALVVTPNDSSIIIKRDNVFKNIKRIQEEETRKTNYTNKKSLADEAFSSGNYTSAENNYNQILKEFPSDQYASSQLNKINDIKKQNEIEKKNKVELEKLIARAYELNNSKNYDEAVSKLQQAIALVPSQKENLTKEINDIKSRQSNLTIENQINKELKTASDQMKNKNYSQAIITYKNIDQTIAKLSNQNLIDKYTAMSQQGTKAVLEKKNMEGEEFKKQLQKAQEYFEKGLNFYDDAEKILKGDPMKSRMNEPEVKDLSDKIIKMREFYSLKNDAYKELKKKNNPQGLSKLISTRDFAKKIASYKPTTEINKLTISIDSLEKILKPQNSAPKKNEPVNTNNSGIQLSAPGELVTGSPNDVFIELAENIDANKNVQIDNLSSLKNEIDKELDFNKKMNASRQEDEIIKIQDVKTEIDLRNIEQANVNVQLQEGINESKRQLEKESFDKKVENDFSNEYRVNNIQDWKNQRDLSSDNKSIEKDLTIENDYNEIEKRKNVIENNFEENKKQNELLSQTIQKAKLENDYVLYKQDSLNAISIENRSGTIQQMKDVKKEDNYTANHLKDEKGIEFPWNTMTERIYKIKNKEGYVTSIITRRIVVDKNGYGVVYEQNTNELGNNTFFKNGTPTTEFVWTNESSGINVIEK
jgi:hypothetical protein